MNSSGLEAQGGRITSDTLSPVPVLPKSKSSHSQYRYVHYIRTDRWPMSTVGVHNLYIKSVTKSASTAVTTPIYSGTW